MSIFFTCICNLTCVLDMSVEPHLSPLKDLVVCLKLLLYPDFLCKLFLVLGQFFSIHLHYSITLF